MGTMVKRLGWVVLLAVFFLSRSVLAAQQAVDLRGYGKVRAEFSRDWVKFTSQDAAKADILFGKLLADMFWDAGDAQVRKTVRMQGRELIIRSWPPYGAIVAARDGNQVMVLGADKEANLLRLVKKEPFFFQPGVQFKPSRAYPVYLDFYDLRAFKTYTHAMTSTRGEGLESHWPFIKRFGLGGMAFSTLAFSFQSPAPGVSEWTPEDYEVREAEKEHGLIVPGIAIGEVPLWVYNNSPFEMMQPSPTALFGGWGRRTSSEGAHYAGWGTSIGLGYLKEAMERYKNSPAVGGWHIYAGAPGVEMGFHDRTTAYWNYSPAGQINFRHWLRDRKGYSLEELGRRWYGNPGHFQSWQEVRVPDGYSFFGNLNSKALRIAKNWKWMKARRGKESNPPPVDAAGWIPVSMPPSQEQGYLPYGPAFYDTHFNPGQWRQANGGKDIYLVCATDVRSSRGISVWLNGNYLGQYKSKKFEGPVGLKVTGMILAGRNELILKVPADGKIFGPVFLTTTRPAYYPYLGREQNARYVDLKEWQAYALYRRHLSALETARSIDPQRPMILSPGSALEIANYAEDLAVRFGLGLQMTGRSSWYFPWWSGLGYVNGFYGTSEPGGTARGKSLDRMLGWILIDGDSSHDLYWDIEDYMRMEKKNGWFTKHKRLIRLFGKSLREKPAIVILHSAQNQLLGSDAAMNWDIGRGELQSAHYDNVYATGRDLEKGLIKSYPVLFDSGTEFMSKELLQAINRYVRAGGTFIALHNSGTHTLLAADNYPISELTGFKPISRQERGTIRFGNNLPVFKGWEGKEFAGAGISLDWLKNEHAKGVGLGLKNVQEGAIPIARWSDGSVAIGYRRVGKGRVIYLGSTFWRNGRDIAGMWRSRGRIERAFFERLFTDLGVKRNADSSSNKVWTRQFITKNGLQEWLIAYNSSDRKLKVELAFKVPSKPAAVWDMVKKEGVAFSYADGWVKLKNVPLAGEEVKVYGVKRASLVGAIPFWWKVKTTYWKSLVKVKVKKELSVRAEVPGAIPFETWRFYPDKDNAVSRSPNWRKLSFDDSRWQKIQTGPWNLRDEKLKDYQGLGLYRAKFFLPRQWSGHQVVLGLYSFTNPIVYDRGEFYLNGAKVATYRARGWNQTLVYDITAQLRAGENILAVKVTGGKEFSGIAGAVWIEPERELSPVINLAGKWEVVSGDYLSRKSVVLPGKAEGRFLLKEVDIPAAWKGRNVYLHIETPAQHGLGWLGSVLVNGHPINYNSYLHPFGLISDLNITPYFRAGKKNRIELWPYGTIPGNAYRASKARMEIRAIAVGAEERK